LRASINLNFDDPSGRINGSLLPPTTRTADEVEIVFIRLLFVDAKAFAMLPDIAPLAGHAVCSVIHLAMDAANTIENPVILLFFELLQSLFVPLNLG
jgi:hypothetical protein